MPGKIVHFEVPSGDADRASGFTMEGFDYRMFKAGEDQGGAIMPSETAGSGLIVYLETDDIDASVAKVRELGGSADDKQPVPTHGWFASCKDTEGNSFSLWQNDPNAA